MTEAEDLDRLIEKIGVEKLHLVGHSYGAMVALAYSNKYKDRLKSLTISEPPLLSINGCNKALLETKRGLINPLKAAFKSNDTTLVMKSIFEFCAGSDIQDQLPPEVLSAYKANLTEMKALSYSENPFPDLNTSFNFPTLIFTSSHVMPILECANSALIESTPHAKHVNISGASHDM